MKILVTGGAGYLGSILVPTLLSEGYKVVVIDNFLYNQTSLLEHCYNKNFTVIRGDVRNITLMKELIKKVDIIFPLACLTGAPLCSKNPIEARSVNLGSIKTLIKIRSKSQPIIFPTTNSGYGIGQKDIYCTEETPLKPISLYAKLKVEAEKILLENGNCITFRFATLFGISPRMRLDLLVNDFTYRAVRDKYLVLFQPHFKRNYLHVRDAAYVFVHALKNYNKMKNQVYNVGLSNANLSKLELCYEIKRKVPDFQFIISEVGEDIDKRNYIVSNAKIEATGFKPKYSLQEGIEELIKGYQIIKLTQFSNV